MNLLRARSSLVTLLRPYLLIILVGSLISFGIGYYSPHLLKNKEENIIAVKLPNKPTGVIPTMIPLTATPTVIYVPGPTPMVFDTYDIEELKGFPPYPGSTFIKKEVYGVCDKNTTDSLFVCDKKEFKWTTPDDFDMVSNYYAEKVNIANSGWSCNGGGGEYGGPRSASTGLGCTKGDLYINWVFDTYPPELNTTNLNLRIFQNGVDVFSLR